MDDSFQTDHRSTVKDEIDGLRVIFYLCYISTGNLAYLFV